VIRRAVDWPCLLSEVLDRPAGVRPHFQPIVDLRRGDVCGYEALARFTDWRIEPAAFFAAADRHGLAGRVEAAVVREILRMRPHFPTSRYVSVNVSPAAMLSDELQEVFAEPERLDAVIVEVTEQTDTDLGELAAALAPLRARGALIAVDDAGAGYASLARITALCPNFVKVDRSLVSCVDVEPAKAAVVETLCDLASRMDAWVVAEGIERLEELDTLIRMRVPLGQGWCFGRPGPGMAELEPALSRRIRARFEPAECARALSPLVEFVPTLPEPVSERAIGVLFDRRPGPDVIALVDEKGRPSGIVHRRDHERGRGPVRSLMLVTVDMAVAAASRRAMSRPPEQRFDPLVCADERGRFSGVVRVERLVEALAAGAVA
jgi:EAL domain-containing protein (putative c-di-GMP-specific phosphodiesterase class I)